MTPASIDDVAKLAGVSPTTVSHAISGRRPVSSEVKERVKKAMEELSYTPRSSARSLATGKTNTLALVVPDISNQYFAELAKGVEWRALEDDYNIVLCNSGLDHAREIRYLNMLKSATVDGVIYAAGAPPTDDELGAALAGLPLVFVDEAIPDTRRTVIMSDNLHGGKMAGRHLAELGHRNVLMLNVGNEAISADEREQGLCEVMAKYGGSVTVDYEAQYTYESGRRAVEPYLQRIEQGEFTAVFAYNDLVALGALDTLRRHGLQVPRDVSVMGFDNIPGSEIGYPSLSTVTQDARGMGVLAAQILISALRNEMKLNGSQTLVPVELVVRESTGPAPNLIAQ